MHDYLKLKFDNYLARTYKQIKIMNVWDTMNPEYKNS